MASYRRRPRRPARRPQSLAPRERQFEPLEDRSLLSVTPVVLPPQFNEHQLGSYLTPASNQHPIAIAEAYLRNHAGELGMLASDVDNYLLMTNYVTGDTGATTLTFQQTQGGMPVDNAYFNFTIMPDGRLLNVGGGFFSGLSLQASPQADTALSAVDAVAKAAEYLGRTATGPLVITNLPGAGQVNVGAPGVSLDEVRASLGYVTGLDGMQHLSWSFRVRTADPYYYRVSIDANSGELVAQLDLLEPAAYQVFALPSRGPNDGPRTIVVDPDKISPTPAVSPSPFGWHDSNGVPGAEFTVTRGNNVNTFLDRDNNFVPDIHIFPDGNGPAWVAQPDGGTNLDFTGPLVPLDLSKSPIYNANAATTNMFYWVNVLHDIHYLYGFDEAARNFQVNNYGRGGAQALGGDAVQAMVQQAQNDYTFDNAFFFPTPDGQQPYIAMFAWDWTSPFRDGDLDPEIIIHEYGHGVSNRITGNSNGLNTVDSGGMGEGWSDFWALMLTQKSASETIDGRPLAAYSTGMEEGLRRFIYKYDIDDINLETFENYNVQLASNELEVHNIGELWAATLWDINHLLTQRWGYNPNVYDSTSTAGNIRALHLITEGLKIQQLNPSFVNARDAILLADQILYGGADQLELWTAFARRGLGEFAGKTLSPLSPIPVMVTSFDIPASVYRPIISLGPDQTVLEGDAGTTNLVFAISLAGFGQSASTVTYETFNGSAVAPGDYTTQSGTLTFSAGGGPQTQLVTVQALGDLQAETDENFTIRLTSSSSNAYLDRIQATGTILNDDVDLSINDVAVVEGDAGTKNAVFTVSKNATVSHAVSFSFTTLGISAQGASDFAPQAGTITIAANASSANITVPIVGDTLAEATETFQLLLSAPSGARIDKGTGVGTITDNDRRPAISIGDAQVTADQAGIYAAVFTVALDTPSGQPVTVNFSTADGSGLAGVDYLPLNGLLNFAPGVTSQQVAIQVIAGASVGPNKTFLLNLSGAANANVSDSQGQGTLIYAPRIEGETIIDNGDPGFAHSSGWTQVSNTQAYFLDYEHHPAGNGSGSATWTFDSLVPGTYQVFARWVPFQNWATNAPFRISDGPNPLATVQVNQRLAPAGELSGGFTWQSLGTFTIGTNTLSVRLNNNANGYVVADAIRIVKDGIPAPAPEINVAQAGTSIGAGDTTPSTSDGTVFADTPSGSDSLPVTFTIENSGNATLNLSGSPRVTVSGANPADFVVTAIPGASVVAGGSTLFQITFRPSAMGLRQAVVSISNNDSDESTYTFAVEGTGLAPVAPLHNEEFPQDVDANGNVTPFDLLAVINRLLSPVAAPQTTGIEPLVASPSLYVDVNGDGRVSPADALQVINFLLAGSATPQSAEAAASDDLSSHAVDVAIGLLDQNLDTTAPEATPANVTGSTTSSTASAPAASAPTPQTVRALFAASVKKTAAEHQADEGFDWSLEI